MGDWVEFNCGEHAGICGELIWLSLLTHRLVVRTQDEQSLEGLDYEVSKV